MKDVNFRDPPVFEVVLSIQFDPIPGLASYRSGDLHARWSEDHPLVSQQPELPPLAPLDEEEGGLFLQLGPSAGSRLWYETANRVYLVQLQADRLAVNWRRMTADPYPRYPEVRAHLVRVWKDLVEVLGATPVANQVEATYVNRIARSPETVLTGWDNPMCAQDDGRFNAAFEQSLRLAGTTKARGQTAVGGRYGEPAETLLSLTVRAVPERADMPIDAIDAARLHIVNRFRDVTDTLVHEEWGVVDDSDA